jgi:hypothetical protein
MSKRKFTICSIAGAFVALLAASAWSAPPGVDEDADRILREMGDYLRTANAYTFRADIAFDEIVEDQMILFGGVAEIALQRGPDRLNVELDSDLLRRRLVFDGKTIAMHNIRRNFYAVTEVPSEIGLALDRFFEVYGSSVPVADFVYPDPYRTLSENVLTGYVVGEHPVNGIRCHHLAFTQETIDWQIWVEVGPRPVPRKLVITYREDPGSPQYIAELSEWNFQPRLSEHYFTFRPPDGANEIEFLPPQEPQNEEVPR